MLQLALFEDDRPRSSGLAAVGYRRPSSILNKGVGLVKDLDYTLNPYVGCQFGCSYCYAAFFQPDEEKVANWGKWVDVKENAVELVRKARGLPGSLVLVGSATDPYQPIEAKLELTRQILLEMASMRPQPRVVVQTRSPLAERDIDVFRRIETIRVNLSITTDDDAVRKAFEPGCPSIERRISALLGIARAVVQAGASLAPLLPMRDPIGLMHRLHEGGVNKFWIATFHEGSGPFSSSTGWRARQIADELNWSEAASKELAEKLRLEAVRLGAR